MDDESKEDLEPIYKTHENTFKKGSVQKLSFKHKDGFEFHKNYFDNLCRKKYTVKGKDVKDKVAEDEFEVCTRMPKKFYGCKGMTKGLEHLAHV